MSKIVEINKKYPKEKYIVLAIFSMALLMRLYGSVRVGMIFDELIWIEIVNKVSFSPDNFNLVLHGAFHPFFEVYLIKLSMLLLNNNFLDSMPYYQVSRLSIRFLHVILSSATIIVIYFLVKDGLGKSAATFASLFLAFSQFHIHFSRVVIQTGPLLFFVSLSLLLFWKAVNQGRDKFIVFTGVSIGFGYLCEETASLLFVIFFIFLLLTGRLMQWLKKWETYAAILAFLAIISPDLYWNISEQNPDMKYHLYRAAKFNGISLLPTSLFIGELILMFVGGSESFIGGFGRNKVWAIEYTPMYWLVGLFCLIATIYSFKNWKNDFIKLMLITFFFIFLFFSIFASSGPLGNFNYWWASISLIPALVLLADMLSRIFQKGLFLKCTVISLVFIVSFNAAHFLSINENIYVRRPSFLAKYYINTGRNNMLKGNITGAVNNLRKAVEKNPESVTALVNLAECYKRIGQQGEADSLLAAALEKGMMLSKPEPYMLDRGYIKNWLIFGYYTSGPLNDSPPFNTLSKLKSNNMKELEYKKVESPFAFIDLKKLLRSPPDSFSYAYTRIYSPIQQKVKFLVGADDGITIWLRREKIYEDNKKFLWFPDEDSVDVILSQGWNDLLVKILYSDGMDYGFTIRLADSKGEVIDNLQSKVF